GFRKLPHSALNPQKFATRIVALVEPVGVHQTEPIVVWVRPEVLEKAVIHILPPALLHHFPPTMRTWAGEPLTSVTSTRNASRRLPRSRPNVNVCNPDFRSSSISFRTSTGVPLIHSRTPSTEFTRSFTLPGVVTSSW